MPRYTTVGGYPNSDPYSDPLDRINDWFVEDILSMSDEEVLAECRENGEDPGDVAGATVALNVAASSKRPMKSEQALRNVLLWQQSVLRDPERIIAKLDGDPTGIAIALFFGPIWEAAHDALRGTEFEIKTVDG